MDRRWVGSDGYEIVLAVRAGRQVLRVRRDGRLVADCASVAEVARHVDLADLCEVVTLPARPAQAERPAARTSSHQG
ncbi:transposase [Nonomuraea sp. MCN248]|uniref:Transposase n=1 Tax=Nonomuraea corallina TaxID=2989783 RepID=A0ABT4SFX4_9ACTN|nr:transposase [Nonomuraea corallina]MDA0636104.1 transposase [Nonomuraea corallina]